MNNYPEWLVEKVARAIQATYHDQPYEDMDDWELDARSEEAEAALDALGFGPWGGLTYWRSSIQWEHDV